MFTLNSLTEQK